MMILISAAGYCQAAAPPTETASTAALLPAVTLPASFRNQPADALASNARDAALGEPELARLIALSRTHSQARSQAVARIDNVRQSLFSSGDIERRMHQAELARIDHQLAEEIAHAWFDARAANTRRVIASATDALITQGLHLINQRVAAGLGIQSDLERMQEIALRTQAISARAAQDRGAAAARIAALTGEQYLHIVPAPAPMAAPIAYAIRAAAPADLLDRPEVRSARLRIELKDASPAELAAFYRETVLKSIEETETSYAAVVNARVQRRAAAELLATAMRQTEALLRQVEAGRIGRLPHIEAQLAAQEARLKLVEAELSYAKVLATLERSLGQ